jgi:hypothetical protein
MKTKIFTQFGTFSVIVMTPFLILSLIFIILFGFEETVLLATLSFVALTMSVCLLIFYRLTIYIDDTYLSFKLGIGLINKKYLISNIKSCKPVKNNPMYGIGIRMIPNGWLYNVTGLSAIELTFKNSKKRVRIGTNKPDEIAETINMMIISDHTEEASDRSGRKGYFLTGTVIFLVLVIPFLIIISGSRETEVTTTNSDFSIKGIYGLTIKYSEIRQLDTLRNLPRIRLRTNGYAFAKTHKGNFRLADHVNAKLFIKDGKPPYIFIKTDDLNVYLNFKKPDKTLELYKILTTNSGQVKK